jgi:hypothetical protein
MTAAGGAETDHRHSLKDVPSRVDSSTGSVRWRTGRISGRVGLASARIDRHELRGLCQ